MPEAVLAGTRTFWREWGTGPRRAVAIHCSLAHSGAWEGVALRLAPELRLQAFDLPGHGRAAEWDGSRDIADQTAEMAEALAGGEEIDLIGHSFGAVAALILALRRPDLVRTLALFEPVLFAAARAEGADPRAPFGPFEAAMARGDREAATERFTALWGGAGAPWNALSPRQRAQLADRIHLIPAADATLHGDRAGILAPGRLEALRAPVLLIEGAVSPPVIAAIHDALARRLPCARRVTIPGAGHMGPVTHPAEVAAAIRGHLGL
ncbi:MAG: alpha/beta hydrolase [Rhodobacteraceae bacterium]|nr:alpha/beta hydrolase [Paracoccaceae bacterium]